MLAQQMDMHNAVVSQAQQNSQSAACHGGVPDMK